MDMPEEVDMLEEVDMPEVPRDRGGTGDRASERIGQLLLSGHIMLAEVGALVEHRCRRPARPHVHKTRA
eukprot:9193431-Prorocentrum_lima.AAC.1